MTMISAKAYTPSTNLSLIIRVFAYFNAEAIIRDFDIAPKFEVQIQISKLHRLRLFRICLALFLGFSTIDTHQYGARVLKSNLVCSDE